MAYSENDAIEAIKAILNDCPSDSIRVDCVYQAIMSYDDISSAETDIETPLIDLKLELEASEELPPIGHNSMRVPDDEFDYMTGQAGGHYYA